MRWATFAAVAVIAILVLLGLLLFAGAGAFLVWLLNLIIEILSPLSEI